MGRAYACDACVLLVRVRGRAGGVERVGATSRSAPRRGALTSASLHYLVCQQALLQTRIEKIVMTPQHLIYCRTTTHQSLHLVMARLKHFVRLSVCAAISEQAFCWTEEKYNRRDSDGHNG